MAFRNITVLISTFIMVIVLASAENGETYVRDACSVTQYTEVCIHSLASFSNTAKRDPRIWARAGISVTIGEAKRVAAYLAKLKNRKRGRGRRSRGRNNRNRNQVAFLDCINLFQDTLDNLHRSLGVLRELGAGQNFQSQMEDVTTWISAALTDEDTCLEGFTNTDSSRNQYKLLQKQVLNTTYVTSNALALVNKLGTTGPE